MRITTTAALHAQINPSGFDTACEVQYVSDASFEASEYTNGGDNPMQPPRLGVRYRLSGSGVALSGLQIDTAYHYRFIATSPQAPAGVDGPDQTRHIRDRPFSVEALQLRRDGTTLEPDTAGRRPPAGARDEPVDERDRRYAFLPEAPDAGAADANVKDIRRLNCPPGLSATLKRRLSALPYNVAHADVQRCVAGGILRIDTPTHYGETRSVSPIYNLVPPAGVAAQFGARFNGFVTAHIDAKVPHGRGLRCDRRLACTSRPPKRYWGTATFWGVPADPSHDAERYCPRPGLPNEGRTNPSEEFRLYEW